MLRERERDRYMCTQCIPHGAIEEAGVEQMSTLKRKKRDKTTID